MGGSCPLLPLPLWLVAGLGTATAAKASCCCQWLANGEIDSSDELHDELDSLPCPLVSPQAVFQRGQAHVPEALRQDNPADIPAVLTAWIAGSVLALSSVNQCQPINAPNECGCLACCCSAELLTAPLPARR
jgi:hypothetical protein